jgi:hypothetical protein
MKQYEKRDPMEILAADLPDPIAFESRRDFVQKILLQEVDLCAKGTQFVDKANESQASIEYRTHINSEGS